MAMGFRAVKVIVRFFYLIFFIVALSNDFNHFFVLVFALEYKGIFLGDCLV